MHYYVPYIKWLPLTSAICQPPRALPPNKPACLSISPSTILFLRHSLIPRY